MTGSLGPILNPLQLKNPIVLVHGLGARSTYGPFEYFYGLPKILRDAGNHFYIANLTAFHSIEWRAKQLKEQIEKAIPEGPINIIAHSMGGLDSRYLASAMGFGERIASITTIGTPHRGSVMGDLAKDILPGYAFDTADTLLGAISSSSEGLRQITTQYCSEVLGPKMPNLPHIAYFSATSAIPDPVFKYSLPVFWLPHRILKNYEGDNDGFVSVHSATWGNHICTYQGDHYAQIGQLLGRSRGLNYLKFYEEILTRLHKEAM